MCQIYTIPESVSGKYQKVIDAPESVSGTYEKVIDAS